MTPIENAVRLVLERAAKACDQRAGNASDFDRYTRRAAGMCAADVRAIPIAPLAAEVAAMLDRAKVEALVRARAREARLTELLRRCKPSVANMAYGWPEDDELVKEIDAALAAMETNDD